MKPAINDASARPRAGGPPPVPSRGGESENRPRSPDIIEVEEQIAELVDRSTQDLRAAWREFHRTGPPQGLSRDLLIRALAHRLQEQTDGGTSRAQRRRLQTLAREFEKDSGSSDPGGPFAAAKPDAPLIKLLIRARRFNTVLIDSDAVPFAARASRAPRRLGVPAHGF